MSYNKKTKKLDSNQLKGNISYKSIGFTLYSELRQAFDLFDADNSGSISVNELKQALGAMGVNITDQEVEQMFSAIDVDKNGHIEFEEFAEIVADSYFRKFSRAEILEAFKRFDRNHDGFIEPDELKHILSQLGRNFSNEEIHRMIAQIDRDGNGKISIEEFAALVERES